jgi:hypothetical protein
MHYESDMLEEEIITKHSKGYRPIEWLDISGRSISTILNY